MPRNLTAEAAQCAADLLTVHRRRHVTPRHIARILYPHGFGRGALHDIEMRMPRIRNRLESHHDMIVVLLNESYLTRDSEPQTLAEAMKYTPFVRGAMGLVIRRCADQSDLYLRAYLFRSGSLTASKARRFCDRAVNGQKAGSLEKSDVASLVRKVRRLSGPTDQAALEEILKNCPEIEEQ